MFSITVSGETLAQVAFNAARLAEELTKQSFVQEQKDEKQDAPKEDPQPENPAPETTEKPKGRGRRTQTPPTEEPKEEPKDEPKQDAKPQRARRGGKKETVVEETEDQKADRQYIVECFVDLGALAQTDTEVRDAVGEVLARNGLANVAEMKTDQLEQMLDDVNELMDRFFEPAQQ